MTPSIRNVENIPVAEKSPQLSNNCRRETYSRLYISGADEHASVRILQAHLHDGGLLRQELVVRELPLRQLVVGRALGDENEIRFRRVRFRTLDRVASLRPALRPSARCSRRAGGRHKSLLRCVTTMRLTARP